MAEPILYILMRTDLASMNAGKGMAQAAHAANAFENAMQLPENIDIRVFDGWRAWHMATPQHFGTTVVLAVESEARMEAIVTMSKALGFPAGVVHDPSYPVRDGAVTHLLPMNTCAYVFSPDRDTMPCYPVASLELHP